MWSDLEAGDLGQTFHGDVAEIGHLQEARMEGLDDVGLKDVAEWNPVQESEQSLEGGLEEAGLTGGCQDLQTKLEDGRKLGAHGRLKVLRLGRGHLIGRVVEDFLGEQAKDDHVILADGQAGSTGGDDLIDERRPVMGPFLLEDRHEDEVELVEQSTMGPKRLIRVGARDDGVDDEVSDACSVEDEGLISSPEEDLPGGKAERRGGNEGVGWAYLDIRGVEGPSSGS